MYSTRLFGGDEIPDDLSFSDRLCPNVMQLGYAPVEVPLGGGSAIVSLFRILPDDASSSSSSIRLTAASSSRAKQRGRGKRRTVHNSIVVIYH